MENRNADNRLSITGRTGRFGRQGVSINFVHDRTSFANMEAIRKALGKPIVRVDTSDFEQMEAVRVARRGRLWRSVNRADPLFCPSSCADSQSGAQVVRAISRSPRVDHVALYRLLLPEKPKRVESAHMREVLRSGSHLPAISPKLAVPIATLLSSLGLGWAALFRDCSWAQLSVTRLVRTRTRTRRPLGCCPSKDDVRSLAGSTSLTCPTLLSCLNS